MQEKNQMEPVRQHHGAFQVAGLTARTTNREENDPATARIGALWNRFFGEETYQATPHRTGDARIFGVYSGYESDAHGAFDVTVGVAVSDATGEARAIEAGDYLVFAGQGEMPQMVIATWQRIWQYFEAHPTITRRYRSDFEAYEGPDKVTIHIGVS
ncbi:putative transcriptional regulator YdeE [Variovorax paradoxus]|jgi:predicted transcriptional regulator YdeE|uniref:GyrI-like domain-containing protein n=1 Tax=Variovorax paradoxus TaxID=34073 RepID=UPI0033946FF4